MLIVLRTLTYEFVILMAVLAGCVIYAPEYCGQKIAIIRNSYVHIFHRVEYNDGVRDELIGLGQLRFWAEMVADNPVGDSIKIKAVRIWCQEFYQVQYTYTDINGERKDGLYTTHIRWKPWEYGYQEGGEIISSSLDVERDQKRSLHENRWTYCD